MEQSNAIKTGLDEDDALFGASVETGSPALVEVYGELGFNWVWLDLEHKNPSAFDSNYLEHMLRAAECSDTELIVRVPDNNPAQIRKVLDAGVRNIVVPRIQTSDELETAVEAAYYSYDGRPGERGLSFGRASGYGSYLSMDGDTSYHLDEDENVLMGVLIENETAVNNIDDILDVPELDFVFPGPGDLGVSMDHTLDYGHPEVQDALSRVEDACLERGVPLLGLLGSNFPTLDDAERAVEDGYQLLGLGNEFSAVRDVFGDRLRTLTKTRVDI
ncbi:HpcH/HpaI aldolase family protein (plasmid) [Haloferax gibbonsii]|uniref:HpcH/HpaI aldolase family protein n=1 Tax=Haloferax gibbonsii TaxID=35746 RepID=A0A871BKM4_HALGI|nr:aldolase/citrate lyase family protein [Haloferax gibbonsii]QOS13572.1 HpcH/HpaI aldolase family protein [Haloferax gibbonsii]